MVGHGSPTLAPGKTPSARATDPRLRRLPPSVGGDHVFRQETINDAIVTSFDGACDVVLTDT
jgi:hypothetical protein